MDNLKRENRFSSPPQGISTLTGSFLGQRAEPFANLSNTFQRSFISTSKGKTNGRNSSAEKSKIKTLPNYEKYSMGNNLPFVTIFQTIQIERLSEEIETQRVRIKQYERQIFNAENFEIQIKELSQKCTGFEDQIGQYREELDKMNKICETLYHQNESLKLKMKDIDSVTKVKLEEQIKKNGDLIAEVQKWKKKYSNSEKQKQKQLQQMKSIMEKQRKSMVEREIKDMELRHQNEKANLSIEIRRLNELLTIKQKDNDELKNELEKGKENLKQLRNYESRLAEQEERVALLSQENLRLSKMAQMNSAELQKGRRREMKMAQQLQQAKEDLADYMHLKEIIQAREDEVERYKEQQKELDREINRNKQISLYNEQLQSKVQSSIQQNEKFSKLLKERSNEIEKWKKMCLQMQGNSEKCRQMQDQVIELQGKLNSYRAQNERLKSSYQAKSDEFDDIVRKYTMMRGESDQMARFEKERKNIEDKYRVQVQRNQQLNAIVEELQRETGQSRNISNKMIETQKIKQFYLRENQKLKKKIEQIAQQLEQVRRWQQQFMRQSMKMKQSDHSISQYQDKIALLTDDINRLNNLLKDKNDEIVRLEDQKISNYSTLTQYKNIEQELQEKDATIQKVKAELDKCYGKIYSYESKIQDLTNTNQQLIQSSRNNTFTLNQLKAKTKECEDLKVKHIKMQQQLAEINQLQKVCQKQQNRITVYLRDIEQLKEYAKQCEDNVQAMKVKERQLYSQNLKLKSKASERSSTNADRVIENSTISSKTSQTCKVSTQKLITKINKLEYTVKQLKQKYNMLLKMSQEECNVNSSQKLSQMSISKASSSIMSN